ncbi:MAG: ABC transporter permease [Elusimicrobia bacterium]|nr:ABC transporter permease [Elusimicrobiota bacterium]
MKTEFLIAKRYLFARRKEVILLLSSLISVAGIAIGVGALLITLSVMNGFHEDLKEKFLATTSAINVLLPTSFERERWEKILRRVRSTPGVANASPYILSQALLTKRGRSQGVAVKGILASLESRVTKIKKQIVEGNFRLSKGEIFVGRELARSFGLSVGDSVFLTIPPPDGFSFSRSRVREFRISGIFLSGMWEYDMNLVYIDLKECQELFEPSGGVSGIEVDIGKREKADVVADRISGIAKRSAWVRTWKESNRNLFAALQLEKKTMFIILSLIVLVAVFNIISSLLLHTIEKVRDIAVLKALGATGGFIERVFSFQGIMSGAAGIIIGNIIAVAVCLLLGRYHFVKIPADVYYINSLPVMMSFRDFIVVDVVSFVLTFLAAFIPARQAGKLNPASVLRYE